MRVYTGAHPNPTVTGDAPATTMYCEMDMRFWLEKAEAEQKA